jgi:hypothetical protein
MRDIFCRLGIGILLILFLICIWPLINIILIGLLISFVIGIVVIFVKDIINYD